MKVVLDEGVPRHLVEALREMGIDASRFLPGWTGASNGALLAAMEEHGFDVLLTNDRNIASQQSLRGRTIAVVALPHNRRRPILERVDDIADTIRRARPGQHIVMMPDGTRVAIRNDKGGTVREELPPVTPFRFR